MGNFLHPDMKDEGHFNTANLRMNSQYRKHLDLCSYNPLSPNLHLCVCLHICRPLLMSKCLCCVGKSHFSIMISFFTQNSGLELKEGKWCYNDTEYYYWSFFFFLFCIIKILRFDITGVQLSKHKLLSIRSWHCILKLIIKLQQDFVCRFMFLAGGVKILTSHPPSHQIMFNLSTLHQTLVK